MSQPKNPWDYMGAAESAILGDVVLDPAEQARWGRAMLFGTLPYMWREKAAAVRDQIYDAMGVKPGHRVLVIGECVAACGFDSDIQARTGDQGHVEVVDITDFARRAYIDGVTGRNGQLATWKWTYTEGTPDNHYDGVAILQSIQHTDNWHESARELTRILKPGGTIALAEIMLGPNILETASNDVHLAAWVDKMFARMGWAIDSIPFYSLEQLQDAFAGLLQDETSFYWKGIEVFWGRKPG